MDEKRIKISEEFAKQLLTALYDIDQPIGKLDKICSSIQDEAVKREFVEALGDLVGEIHFKLMRPIYRQHPDLGSPDEPGPWLHKGA